MLQIHQLSGSIRALFLRQYPVRLYEMGGKSGDTWISIRPVYGSLGELYQKASYPVGADFQKCRLSMPTVICLRIPQRNTTWAYWSRDLFRCLEPWHRMASRKGE